jgi:hypothetical protein
MHAYIIIVQLVCVQLPAAYKTLYLRHNIIVIVLFFRSVVGRGGYDVLKQYNNVVLYIARVYIYIYIYI